MRRAEIIIPASTSNLGASFDTCGLALALYLKVSMEAPAEEFEFIASGEGAESVPRDESNLIARVARFVAARRRTQIGGARVRIDNQIPLARGLGSSSAAIIAGISVYESISEETLTHDEIFEYALEFEGHGDNLAPSLLGSMVVACVVDTGEGRQTLLALKRAWPSEIKIVLAIPDREMDTQAMRRVLPDRVPLPDAVFNLQRAALLQASISEGRFDLLGEALRDRLHQPHRTPFGPGISEVLKLNDELARHPGLLGVALSGAGSTTIAFATGHFDEIAAEMGRRVRDSGAGVTMLEVEVDRVGRVIRYE